MSEDAAHTSIYPGWSTSRPWIARARCTSRGGFILSWVSARSPDADRLPAGSGVGRWVSALAMMLLLAPGHAGAASAPPATLGSYVLFALESLHTKGLTVEGGAIGVNDGDLQGLTGPIVAPASEIAAETVTIDPASRCRQLFGDQVVRTGPGCAPPTAFTSPLIAAPAAACGYPAAFPACDANRPVSVGTGSTRQLSPGTYGTLDVAGGSAPGSVVLSSGTYVFCSVRTGRGVRITGSGSTTVFVSGDVNLGADTVTAPSSTSGSLHLVTNGTSIQFAHASDVTALLCAPNADLRVTSASDLRGTFLARTIYTELITVHPTTTIPATTTTTIPGGTTTTTIPSDTTTTSLPGATTTTIPSGTTTTSLPGVTTTTIPGGTTTTSLPGATTTTIPGGTTTTSLPGATTTTIPGGTTTTSLPGATTTTSLPGATTTTIPGGTTTTSLPGVTTTTIPGGTTTTSLPGATTTTIPGGTTTTSLPGVTTTTIPGATTTTIPGATTTTSLPGGTTTTTLPPSCQCEIVTPPAECVPTGPETCGDCIDNDCNGLVDFEDPACCAPQQLMTVQKAKIRPHGSGSRLLLRSSLGASCSQVIGGSLMDESDLVQLQLRTTDHELLCARIPGDKFMKLGKQRTAFWDLKQRCVCAEQVRDAAFICKRGRMNFYAQGADTATAAPQESTIRITVGVRNRFGSAPNFCSTVSQAFRTKGNALVFP